VLTDFFARCYSWGATSDYLFKIGDFATTGTGWPKISGKRGHPPPTILFLKKRGQMIFRMVLKTGQIFLQLCRNSRVWQTDGRTDRILIARQRLNFTQRRKNTKRKPSPRPRAVVALLQDSDDDRISLRSSTRKKLKLAKISRGDVIYPGSRIQRDDAKSVPTTGLASGRSVGSADVRPGWPRCSCTQLSISRCEEDGWYACPISRLNWLPPQLGTLLDAMTQEAEKRPSGSSAARSPRPLPSSRRAICPGRPARARVFDCSDCSRETAACKHYCCSAYGGAALPAKAESGRSGCTNGGAGRPPTPTCAAVSRYRRSRNFSLVPCKAQHRARIINTPQYSA